MATRRTSTTQLAAATARAYRAALSRLIRGEGRHPKHAGRLVRITPAAVALEAGKSRNPLYNTHRDILDEIRAAVELPKTRDLGTRVDELRAANRVLRAEVRRLAREQQALATENLALLHRAQVAERRADMKSVQRRATSA